MTEPIVRKTTQPQTASSVTPQPTTLYTSVWLKVSLPIIVIVGVLVGSAFDVHRGRANLLFGEHSGDNAAVPGAVAQRAQENQVLIVTSNAKKQRNVILTLSPRGFIPVLAVGLDDVKAIRPSDASKIRFAVLDEESPQAGEIAQSLRTSLPSTRIILLNASCAAEDIGPLLLSSL